MPEPLFCYYMEVTMNIKVKFFATFRQGREKIMEIKVKERYTVEEILDTVEIKPQEIAILLVNGLDAKIEHILKDGDVISLFPPVGGG